MMPAGYGVVLIFWYAYYGVLFSFSLGLVFLALLPLTFLLGRSAQFVKELTPFIVLVMSYGSSSLFSELARIGSLIESDKLAAFRAFTLPMPYSSATSQSKIEENICPCQRSDNRWSALLSLLFRPALHH